VGAKVIRNKQNFSYPYTQNQGIKIATGDVFAFLNNDIIVAVNWDQLLLETMQINRLDIATSCGIEQVENKQASSCLLLEERCLRNVMPVLPQSESRNVF
jgi:glycosyltransferase involved in cell wall biosynthesis